MRETKQKAHEGFDPDKRIEPAKSDSKALTSKAPEQSSERFDPDKRVGSREAAGEASGREGTGEAGGFDPDKRVGSREAAETQRPAAGGETEIANDTGRVPSEVRQNEAGEKALADYKNDLARASEVPDTLDTSGLDFSNFREASSDEVKAKREELTPARKNELKREWEAKHGTPWPTYKNDMVNNRGEVIRKAGQDYDMHHTTPLKLGGENTVGNITPLSVDKHTQSIGGSEPIHAKGGSYSRLIAAVKGVQA